MGSIVLKSLSILLGLFFIFIGILKISCFLSKDLHKDLRKDYVKYAKIFPFSQMLGIKIPAKWYRKVFGSSEIICGIALAFFPKAIIKRIANIFLTILMALAVYSHYMVSDRFERMAPALVFLFMLVGRMVIEWQVKQQTREVNGEIKNLKQD